MWMDETDRPDEQPEGFATPEVAPLGVYSTTLTVSAPGDVPAPADYAAAVNPGPALDTVAPAPPATRDPRLPFEAGQEDQMALSVKRDPREPFVNLTPLGAPDFAPPTGVPATTNRWAPPTGAPVVPTGFQPGQAGWGPHVPTPDHSVGAIARQGMASSADPYAQRWASLQAGKPAMPGGYPVPSSMYAAPGKTRQGIVAQYWASDALGKLKVVLQALPWPVALILLIGAVLANGSWAIWAICIAFLVCSSNAKIGQRVLNLMFMIASGVYFVSWLAMLISQSTAWGYTIYNAHFVIGQWLCVVLMVATPIVVWRSLEQAR